MYQWDELQRGAHNNGFAVRLQGALEVPAVARALEQLAARHAMLRTAFRWVDGEPEQRVEHALAVPLLVNAAQDWTEDYLQQQVKLDCNVPFDLTHGPMLRAHLYRTSEAQAVLLMVFDHLACDGWSYWQLLEEFGALLANPDGAGSGNEHQYRDYISWQRDWIASAAGQSQAAYWHTVLGQPLPVLQLPLDRAQAGGSDQSATVSVFLQADLRDQVHALAKQEASSLFVILLAAYQIVLHRHTGQDDIVVGTPMPGRSREQWDRVVGDFVNPVAIRTGFDAELSVKQLLSKARSSVMRGMQHQDYPFGMLVEQLQPTRKLGIAPVFQTMFTLQKARRAQGLLSLWSDASDAQSMQWGGLAASSFPMHQSGGAREHALVLEAIELDTMLRCDFRYDAARFDAESVERIAAHFQNVLRGMVARQDVAVDALDLLDSHEREQIQCAFNATDVAYPQDQLIHQLFEAQAAAQPDALALVFADDRLSYGDLNRRANRLAHRLIGMGVQRDDRVAISVERSVEMVVAVLAVLKAGAAYVPLDPTYPRERLAHMYADSAPVVLLTQSWLKHGLPAGVDTLYLDRGEANTADHNPEVVGLSPSDLAYVIYTSGSTGLPKGVMVEHGNVLNFVHWALEHFDRQQLAQTVFATSINFDLSVYELFAPLAAGCTATLVDDLLATPAALVGASLINTVPSAAQALLTMGKMPASVRFLNVAGEPLKRYLVERLFAETRIERLCNLYGPTETTTYSTWVRMERGMPFAAHIGTPVANTQVYILDACMDAVPIGVVGEIYIGGAGVTRGYLNQPALTEARYLADPFSRKPGARLYKTGDLGRRLSDGNIEYLGRNDFQVKVRGFRIELGEIEAKLSLCDGVREAVVIAREDMFGDVRLVAYVTAREEHTPTAQALRTQLATSLADYMVPAAFVLLDAFPLTTNGKLDRKALPAPDLDALQGGDYVAPEGETEVLLAQVWAALLGVQQVGRHDDFFALGGHSLLAVQVISRLREQLGVELALRDLFATPSLAGFASIVAAARMSERPAIVPVDRNQPLPLSWAQQRLWMLDQLDGGSVHYNMPLALNVQGPFNEVRAELAFAQIIERHEPLRTIVVKQGAQATQVICDGLDFRLGVVDLSSLAPVEQEAQVRAAALVDATTAFDLGSELMLRARYLRQDEQAGVLLFNMHHIASDGWSIGVLIREFLVHYEALGKGEASALAPLSVSYADYAHWQKSWLAGEAMEQQLGYWDRQLADLPTVHSLPLDRARPAQQRYQGASHVWILDKATELELVQLARTRGATLFMVLHGALSVLLARHGNSGDIVIGTPVANRPQKALEELIGVFVNTLVLRSDCSGNPRFVDFLETIKAVNADAQAHQDVPFEYIVERLKPARSTQHSPLFQVMFSMNTHLGAAGGAMACEELLFTPRARGDVAAKFELTFNISDIDDGIALSIDYNTDLFDADTIATLARHFETLLKGIAAAPETPIYALPLLSDAEQRYLLQTLNATQAAFPDECCIHDLIETQVESTPANIAVVDAQASVTYAELNARANQLAHYLREQGVTVGSLVGLCVERGIDMVVGLLGVLKAGAAYVPLDPGYPPSRLAHMVEHSALSLLLTQQSLRKKVTQFTPAQAPFTTAIMDSAEFIGRLQGYSSANMARDGEDRASNLAYVIYTSGSTGMPKGVMVEHRALVNRIDWMQGQYALTAADVVLQKTPFSFDVSVWELTWPFTVGARLVMAKPEGHKDPDYLRSVIQQQAVTTLHFVPSMLQAMLNVPGWAECTSIRQMFCSGEALTVDTVSRHYAQHAAPIHNLYGPTEAAIDVSYWECPKEHALTTIPIGKPIQNISLYVLGSHMQLQPAGVPGELHIGGVGLARGYLHQPELTDERLIANLFHEANNPASSARLYKTGDLVRYMADGNIEYLGRMDDQVKIRGFRIELGEIEHCLTRHAQVESALVLAREDVPDNKRLVAYLTAATGDHSELIDSVRAHLQASLPEYMVPALYVVLDTFPLTPNGKLDKKALPAPVAHTTQSAYFAPATSTEHLLTAIWAELLHLPAGDISMTANFFALGGHSLLLIELLGRLQQAGLQSDARTVFAAKDLAALAVQLDAGAQTHVAPFVAPANAIPNACARIEPHMLPLCDLTQQRLDALVASMPGGAANVQDIYPLAPLQEGILFHHLMHADKDPYIIPILMSVENPAQRDAFMAALQNVVDRHDVLRTSIAWEQLASPIQIVCRTARLHVAALELNDTTDAQAQMLECMAAPQWMNLTQGPLLRATVAQDPHGPRCFILLQLHHIISDHIGLEIICAEVGAQLAGNAAELAPALPFREFVAHAMHQARSGNAATFFRNMLGDVNEPTAPFDLQDVHGDGSAIIEARKVLAPALADRIRQVAKARQVSPATVFHAAWAMVVAACSGRDDVVFGTVLSGRLQGTAGAADTMGMFMNTLPVRLQLAGKTVLQLLQQTESALTELLAYEQASLALAKRSSALPGGVPLFAAMLNYRHSSGAGVLAQRQAAEETGITLIRVMEKTNYPFIASVDDFGDGFAINAQVDRSINAQRVLAYIENAVAGIADALLEAPLRAALTLSVLPQAEQDHLLCTLNGESVPFPREHCVHTLFEAQVLKTPEHVAVVHGDMQLSYAALNVHANQVAHVLLAMGAGPDVRVALCLERSCDELVALLAILKAGAAYVPLDPAYPATRLAYMLGDSAPLVVLTQSALLPLLDAAGSNVPRLALDAMQDTLALQTGDNPDASALGMHARQLAYIIYTSGSTGQPKGVMVEHRQVVNLWRALASTAYAQCPPAARIALNARLVFDASLQGVVQLLSGHCLVLIPHALRGDGAALADFLFDKRIDAFDTTPAQLRLLLDSGLCERAVAQPKTILVGGEAIARSTWRTLQDAVGIDAYNVYGPTECTVDASYARLRGGGASPHIGRPMANARFYLLNEAKQPVPAGISGEIWIGGAGVSRGYLNQEALSAERFVSDPFCNRADARMYRTGDLGRWLPDGNIEYLGRNDFQVKLRGYRIELGEIEAALRACPGVRDALVIVHEDQSGDRRLVSYLLTQGGQEVQAAALREQLLGTLADYMVPACFVTLAAFPLTSNGKLDRKALPVPDVGAVARRQFAPLQGAVEAALGAIWQDLLGLDRIGRNDDFFELGGHSLLAVQVISRIRDWFGVELPLRELFLARTPAACASAIANAGRSDLSAIMPADRSKALPLSWAQRRLWFLDQLNHAAGAAYNSPIALRLTGELNEDALQDTLDRLLARHESLRTHFVLEDGVPVQHMAPADIGLALVRHDLTAVCHDEQTTAVAGIGTEEAEQAFNLATGPLVRGRLLRLAQDEHVLLLTLHHIVTDGWSTVVLVEEFGRLYGAFCEGRPDPLLPLAIQYADYAAWQHNWLQGDELERQLGFWKAHLTDAPVLLELPTDRPRPSVQSYAGSELALRLPAQLSASLRALSQRHGVSLFMTMLTGWSVLLARISGQDEVVIGTPIANRQRAETEGLVGFFVNTLALVMRLDPELSVEQLLEQVRTTTLAAFAHQDLPFEQVVEAIRPIRRQDHSPIFQAMLTMNNVPERGDLTLPGLVLSAIANQRASIHFDLHLTLGDIDDNISGTLAYASDLFDQATAQRLVQQLETLLTGMVEAADCKVSLLPLLDDSARQRLLVEFNDTAAPLPELQLIGSAFEAQVAAEPDALAVVYENDSLTYAELNRRANLVARQLLAQGVVPDDCVALCVERSVEMFVGILGIVKAGAAYVPMDPHNPADRLAYLLSDCAPVAVLTHSSLTARLPVLTVPVLELDAVALQQGEAENPDPRALGLTGSHLAYVIYTSGSTGAAKGVMVEHHSALNFWAVMNATTHQGCPVPSHIALNASFAFDMSLKGVLQVLSGHCVHIVPQAVRADGALFMAFLARHQIDAFDCTPSQLELLLATGLLEAGHYQPGRVLMGGEAIPAATWDKLRQCQSIAFFNMYGPTECTVDATIGRIEAEHTHTHLGRPIGNAQIYILDRLQQPVPTGVWGEIHIGGEGVARGYLKRPELTDERFMADPFGAAGGRLYRTGDVGRWRDDGRIEYRGRNDFQVKLRGYRIELGEIEAGLAACTGVREAVVVAREDAPGEKRLVAYLVAEDGVQLQMADVRTQLALTLAEYMVPSAFVVLDQLPLTRNGKLDRRALPPPDQSALVTGQYEAPQGDVELAISEIWKDLLKLDSISRHNDFFALGGHSLLAALVIARISSQLAVELPMATLFTHPTLKSLGEAVVELTLASYSADELELAAADMDDLSYEEIELLLEQERALTLAADQKH